jgi:hypothetical protein
MEEYRHFTGATEEELWQQVEQDFAKDPDPFEYSAILTQGGRDVTLVIDIDPGGGFENGYESTVLSAPFHNADHFKFALHHEGFLDEIGKFFGMQDLEIGDAAFDAAVVVKSSDATRIRTLLQDGALRSTLQELTDFTFEIVLPHGEETEQNHSQLRLTLNDGVNDPESLRPLYRAFFQTLVALEPSPVPMG